MPALVITSVDFTTDTFTSVAHGLNTGDGPAALFVGVGGVIPTAVGLTAGLDTWVIRVDADHFKLADTSAHALSNTPFNLTTNGTLPLTLGIGLPYRRARTYAALQQIKSADLDALQDSHAALYSFLVGNPQALYSGIVLASGQHMQVQGAGMYKRGSRTFHVPASTGAVYNGASATLSGGFWTFTASGATIIQIPLFLEQGEQLNSVSGWVACGATDVIQMGAWHTTGVVGGSQSDTQLGATQTSAGHSSLLEQLVVSGLSQNVGTGLESYYVRFTCTARATSPFVIGVDCITTI